MQPLSTLRQSLIYILLLGALLGIIQVLYQGGVHLSELKADHVSLAELPSALALSTLRMVVSYLASLLFAFLFGMIAARSTWGERVILPLLDILQSMPVVTFFPAAISLFIGITHGHRMGVEMAAVFLIFTSQAWNMAFSVYESVRGIPSEQLEAVDSLGVSGSLRFWKLFAPASVPRLVYNSILSWSNGWFFLVACEIIAVGPVKYQLPGIGSFLAKAAEQDEIRLVMWGLFALTTFILLMDFFIWRPASHWALRFKTESHGMDTQPSLGSSFIHNIPSFFISKLSPVQGEASKLLDILVAPIVWLLKRIILPILWDFPIFLGGFIHKKIGNALGVIAYGALSFGVVYTIIKIIQALIVVFAPPLPSMISQIPLAILASTMRVIIALLFSVAWVIPLTLWVWDKPKLREGLLTMAQVGASIPATALFPLIVLVGVKKLGGGMEFSSIVLLITGMQWYVLFNNLGGAAAVPDDIADATRSLGLSKFLTWKRLVLPACRPALITGAITAWGGGWNALVVSEYVTYKTETLQVVGIGALINNAVYKLGDIKLITICIFSLILWIILINTVLWKPLYHKAFERYKFDG